MEKRNIIEDGRTPEDGVKMADDLDKVASDLKFETMEQDKLVEAPIKETSDEKKDKHG